MADEDISYVELSSSDDSADDEFLESSISSGKKVNLSNTDVDHISDSSEEDEKPGEIEEAQQSTISQDNENSEESTPKEDDSDDEDFVVIKRKHHIRRLNISDDDSDENDNDINTASGEESNDFEDEKEIRKNKGKLLVLSDSEEEILEASPAAKSSSKLSVGSNNDSFTSVKSNDSHVSVKSNDSHEKKRSKTLGIKLGDVASYLPPESLREKTPEVNQSLTNDFVTPPSIPHVNEPTIYKSSEKHKSLMPVAVGKPLVKKPTALVELTPRRESSKLGQEIINLQEKINQANRIINGTNLETLPDKGEKMKIKLRNMKYELNQLKKEYKVASEKMQSIGTNNSSKENNIAIPFESLPDKRTEYKRPGVFMVAESLTGDALIKLHSNLKESPMDRGLTDPGPEGLKVELLPHQEKAMAWLLWRETEHPKGGILADDMGLGKTLSMIALILRSKELRDGNDENVVYDKSLRIGGTLVICPMSVLKQWESEIKQKCSRGLLKTLVYHGKDRSTNARSLSRYDVVLTTYNIIGREGQGIRTTHVLEGLQEEKPGGLLFELHWNRVILDEAHSIRNAKTLAAKATHKLSSNYRWCLTGTPIHNSTRDLYSLICFLQFTPFNSEVVWRRVTENKSAMGIERLNTIMKSIMIRRTKQDLQTEGQLQCLPTKNINIIEVSLDPEEDAIYQRVLQKSQTLMAKFIMQKAERMVETGEDPLAIIKVTAELEKNGLLKKNKKGHVSDDDDEAGPVNASHILLQLLRLRQICCHACLVKDKIDEEMAAVDGIEEATDDVNELVSNLKRLSMHEKPNFDNENPAFERVRPSSKVRAVIDLVLEIREKNEKIIIVSQWTSMLNIISEHLKEAGIRSTQFTGKLNPKERQEIIDAFNQEHRGPKILLLSLTAGGTGVNLIGGNNMLLVDIHWNPQLEAQAMDRIYRVGQTKDVKVYRFICNHTVEQSIQTIQDKKLSIAAGILDNRKDKQKLNFEDLKSLFLSC